MSDWRFHLLTLPNREWVDRDLQLQAAKVTQGLSTPDSISGRLPLGYRMINTPTGKPGLTERGAAIIAEQEGRDPVFAIVDSLTTDDDWLNVAAGGFTAYPTGMPWVDKEFSSTKVDPLDVVRMIWANLQNKPNGNLQVIVDQTKSGQYLGKPEGHELSTAKQFMAYMQDQLNYTKEQAEEDAKLVEQYATKALAAAGLPAGGLLLRSTSVPTGDKRSKRNLWFQGNAEGLTAAHTWNGKKWVELSNAKFNAASDWYFEWLDQKDILKDSKAMYAQTKEEFNHAKSKVSELSDQKAEPYTLSWWDTPDVGTIITDLATQTPFDYREETTWNGDDELTHRLRIGYPELGARRENLRLEIGVNVTAPPPLTESDYASEITVLGAGEGRSMVRSTASRDSGRLRRATVIERKEFTKSAQTNREANTQLKARTSEWTFDNLSLVDHPMCPYGSFDPGDWLYLVGDAGWTQLDQWVRVLEIEVDCPTGKLNLKVSST